MPGEGTNENVELSGEQSSPPTEERQMWIKRLWNWLFGPPKTVVQLRDECKMTRSEFQQVLKERKSELGRKPDPEVRKKADEKRLEGFKQIVNLNSKRGVHPLDLLPEGTVKSGLDPLDLFPEEIWLQVLKKLTPNDRLMMYHVHWVFRDMLKSNLIRDTLLPYVLDQKIRFKVTPDYFSLTYVHSIHREPGPYYNCPGKEDLKQLMNIRLVSKSLRDAMDKWFEKRLLYVMRTPRARDGPDALNTVNLNLWQNGREMLEAKSPHRFFLRSLTVNFIVYNTRFYNQADNLNVRVRNLKGILDELLEKVGEQLLHFHIYLRDDDLASSGDYLRDWRSLEEVGNIIRAWLLEMPNLKWLHIECPHLGVSGLLNEAMPRLNKLERFDVTGADLIPIANAIISANPHIKFHSRLPSDHNGTIQYFTPPALALPLEWVPIGCLTLPCAGLVLPQAIPENNWNLKSIDLFLTDDEGVMYSIDSIFRFIQKFPTLEDVCLGVDYVKIGDEINFFRLPNLKHFCIEFGPTVEYSGECIFFFSLQFLLHCKNLRSLVWDNKMNDLQPIRNLMKSVGGNEGIWVDFTDEHPNRYFGSNLRDVFPHLRSIKVGYCHIILEDMFVGHQDTYRRLQRAVNFDDERYQGAYRTTQKAEDLDDERWAILWVLLAIVSLFLFSEI